MWQYCISVSSCLILHVLHYYNSNYSNEMQLCNLITPDSVSDLLVSDLYKSQCSTW